MSGIKAEAPPLPPIGAEGETAGAPAARPAAKLDFLDPAARSTSVVLGFPFRLDNVEVTSVTVRRLTVAEIAQVASSGSVDLFDFYAAMTGLPGDVLRGLDSDDGDRIIEACSPFLPRLARHAFSAQIPGSGDGSL